MIKFRVIIQPPASAEIEQAFLWIAERNPAAAVKWFHGLHEAIRGLATFLERCPFAPENDAFQDEIRQLIYGRGSGRYRVFSPSTLMSFVSCTFATGHGTTWSQTRTSERKCGHGHFRKCRHGDAVVML